MEKASSKSKSKILRLIPKSASAAVSFQNPRVSGNSNNLKYQLYRAFSGPMISMIPAEAREESKSSEMQEPTSPKISCMGQIKHKKKICRLPPQFGPVIAAQPATLKKNPSVIKKIFNGRRKSDDSINRGKPPLPDRAPALSHLMRFASSRDAFACRDWATEAGDGGDWGSYSDGDDDVVFPMLGSGAGLVLEPRKEINLWKRRTVAQLKPLQLNVC
ncbi:hypothetical protein SASPL_149911 [Salvia splendens]|uniref:Uncharacterized protein n=1 Tax=Salvia splendens TaxID=180675 RepID=A0A8X8Z203_SALSN|nr:uncharacterized protein At1g76070-like [Salvia splendens]KAG6388483.1 hypothetical protein SASPL_149911 [Salvia splendens]